MHTQEYLLPEDDRLHMLLVLPYLHNILVPEPLVHFFYFHIQFIKKFFLQNGRVVRIKKKRKKRSSTSIYSVQWVYNVSHFHSCMHTKTIGIYFGFGVKLRWGLWSTKGGISAHSNSGHRTPTKGTTSSSYSLFGVRVLIFEHHGWVK